MPYKSYRLCDPDPARLSFCPAAANLWGDCCCDLMGMRLGGRYQFSDTLPDQTLQVGYLLNPTGAAESLWDCVRADLWGAAIETAQMGHMGNILAALPADRFSVPVQDMYCGDGVVVTGGPLQPITHWGPGCFVARTWLAFWRGSLPVRDIELAAQMARMPARRLELAAGSFGGTPIATKRYVVADQFRGRGAT